MSVATRNYIKKSIERLYGIISGISINCHINDKEIIAVKNWMETHELLNEFEPFKELDMLLNEILEDGIVDDQEREDLLEWCSDVLNEHGFLGDYTQVVRRLHGIFSGIMCDQVIKENELEGLKEWLLDYEPLHNWWPINELKKLIDDIMKDGRIDKEEHQRLHIFFNDFAEHVIKDPVINDQEYWMNRHMFSPCPVFKPVASLCEKNPEIIFKGRLFCFTGPAASGRRKDICQKIESIGAVPCAAPVKDLDYLVIGAQSSPAWVYSTYGRKIEAVRYRIDTDKKCQTHIVGEYDFIKAAIKAGAPFQPPL
jgi:NAD-dependent DNA ligase